ncbi:hypothetical protein J1N35_002120 [Gossypium stocksii]|uniref:SHSP domain-containing protein n=1 Tax=Gossypium stocksii TaxID=47602 RepID=A0A9D4AM26_9ROSI|nr:hypothetical protein J1N35_002120 [Gossypium stocksii]
MTKLFTAFALDIWPKFNKINGQRNVEEEDKNDTWHGVERNNEQFMTKFRLPENVKMDQVKSFHGKWSSYRYCS